MFIRFYSLLFVVVAIRQHLRLMKSTSKSPCKQNELNVQPIAQLEGFAEAVAGGGAGPDADRGVPGGNI